MIDLRGLKLLLVVMCCFVLAAAGAPSYPSQAQSDPPPDDEQCLVGVEGIGIEIRSGPSTACPVVAFWLTEVPLPVIGQAQSGGQWWWQLRLTRIEQAWVPQRDVIILTEEACQKVEVVPAPACRVWTPVRRVPQPPAEPASSGWGACGSCTTCGYESYECVLSPAGECLWDPATCAGSGPPDEGDGWGACGSCSACGPYNPDECVLSPEGVCLWDPATCHIEEEEACIPEPDVIICSEGPDETFTCPGDSRCPDLGSEYPTVDCYRSACYDSCGGFVYWNTYCPQVLR